MDDAYRELYRAIGAIIKRRRRELNLSQEQLGTRLDLSRAALANIETGRQNVLVHQLFKVADALDIDVHDLVPQEFSARAEREELPVPADLRLPADLTNNDAKSVASLLLKPPQKSMTAKGK